MDYKEELTSIQKNWANSSKAIMSKAENTSSVFNAMKDRAISENPKNSKKITRDYIASIKEIEGKKEQRLVTCSNFYNSNISDLDDKYKKFQEQESLIPKVIESPIIEKVTPKKLDSLESYVVLDSGKCYVVTQNGKTGSEEISSHMKGVLGLGQVCGYRFNMKKVASNKNYDVVEVIAENHDPRIMAKSLISKLEDKNIYSREAMEKGIVNKTVGRISLSNFL